MPGIEKLEGADYAYVNAADQGIKLGKMLSPLQPRSIHFIAHSAGSNLIQHAAETVLKEVPASPPVIHMTFLDAFTPNLWLENYGQNADYAEQYVDSRVLPFTDTQLHNAINFDVTLLGGDATWYNGIKGHGWPIEYYLRTIGKDYLPGFPFALEYGAKNSPLYKALPANWRGQGCIATRGFNGVVSYPCLGMAREYIRQQNENFIDSIPDGVVTTFNVEKQVLLQAIDTDLYYIKASATGIVNFVKSLPAPSASTKRIHLKRGSPAWISLDEHISDPVNILEFDYEFPENSSDGLFTVFVDGKRIYSRDESLLDHNKTLSDSVILPEPLMPGKHAVVFRLDPLSESNSEIFIANARFGMVTVQNEASSPIQIDTIAPITTPTISGTLGVNDWYTSSTTIRLNAVDNEGGVGVQKTEYSLDNGAWLPYASTSPIAITTEGKHTILYRSTDWFGNTEATGTAMVNIDLTAPEAKISADILLKDLKVVGSDNLSSTTVAKDAQGNYTITDQAGHTTKLFFKRTYTGRMLTLAKLTGIQYDAAPAVTLPSSSFVYVWTPNNAVPTLNNQTVVANKTFTIHATYDKRTNKTNVLVLQRGQQFKKQSYPGLKIVTLTTSKGNVGYEL